MKANRGIGAKKPTDIEELSAIQPMNIGKMAPPTIDITIKEDAFLVFSPSPFIPRAKMVGNMMDMKKKIRKSERIENQPILRLTIGNSSTHIRA